MEISVKIVTVNTKKTPWANNNKEILQEKQSHIYEETKTDKETKT